MKTIDQVHQLSNNIWGKTNRKISSTVVFQTQQNLWAPPLSLFNNPVLLPVREQLKEMRWS
jgi:hypothetical protein